MLKNTMRYILYFYTQLVTSYNTFNLLCQTDQATIYGDCNRKNSENGYDKGRYYLWKVFL